MPFGSHLGEQSDRDLVLAYKAGRRGAYDEMYRRHRRRVASICYRLLHNPQDAEEATQETFLRAYQALARFNGQFQLGAWLARIATNVCVDQLRSRARTNLVALPSTDDAAGVQDSPEAEVVGEYPRLDVAIDDISPLHARALTMRAVDGLSHVEMADRLEMSAPQVKALLHRARHSLRRAWDEAQGWLIMPLLSLRGLSQRSQAAQSSSLVAGSPQFSALLEKAAAASAALMLFALGSTSTTSEFAGPPGQEDQIHVDAAPRQSTHARSDRTSRARSAVDVESDAVVTPPGAEIVLPIDLEGAVSQIQHRSDGDEDRSDDSIVDPGSADAAKAVRKVRDTVTELTKGVPRP
ncbi:MAG TPA: RNA polymerase sigma factor [Actinomycetota bacterium]|nr:RNA polymerase sigma factor [Actinomycetota bacterium]